MDFILLNIDKINKHEYSFRWIIFFLVFFVSQALSLSSLKISKSKKCMTKRQKLSHSHKWQAQRKKLIFKKKKRRKKIIVKYSEKSTFSSKERPHITAF